MGNHTSNKIIAQNRKARHNYTFVDTYECGIVLTGTEVKSLRAGKMSITESFAVIAMGEVFLVNSHIDEYDLGTWTNHDPRRNRKLLLNRREINKIVGTLRDGNRTLIPTSVYLKGGKAKVELAVAEGKNTRDKRETIKRRDADREMARALKSA